MRALGNLLSAGAVSRERTRAVPHRSVYSLTTAGTDLLAPAAAAAGWERRTTRREHHDPPGLWPLRLIANSNNRAIILAFADGPLTQAELRQRCDSNIGHSALRKRVTQLLNSEILIPLATDGPSRYELEPRARRLGHAALLAARWEWRHASHDPTKPAADLASLVHLIAPVTRIVEPLAGVCQLHVDSSKAPAPDIYVVAEHGRLRALSLAPCGPLVAEGHATPEGWCNAILRLNFDEVHATGDRRLVERALHSLRDALVV